MEKLIITLLILVLLTSNATSQTASKSDSTVIPNAQLKAAINIIEMGKVEHKELLLTKEKVILLDSSIKVRDKIISLHQVKDSVHVKMVDGYKSAIGNLNITISNQQQMFDEQKKKLNGQKFKKWVTFVLGLGAGYLIFK